MPHTPKEMMTIAAARTIRNKDIVFCGTGISMIAAMAAKHISAPESIIFFETGAIDSRLEEVPLAVGDPRVMYRTALNGSLLDAFATMQNRTTGRRVVGILGAAQIDPYGNLNSTVIGDYDAPRVRFSGSGGAADVASFVSRTIIFMQHEKRKFVPKVDYLTSPGWLSGGDTRRQAGLCEGGPHLVITNMAIMGFDPSDHRMFLKAIYPGVRVSDVTQNTGFEIDVSRVESTPPPSENELRILRHICDPQKLILG